MFKRPTKKQLLFRRIVVSTIATSSVLVILTITILFMMGYRLDTVNGRLAQGALVQMDSTPGGADVWIDGRNTGVRTAGKQMVVAGTHTILFAKNKYEDWSRHLDIAAGTLTWLNYARLVPKERAPEAIAHYQSIVGAKASPDNKYMLLQEAADKPVFQLADLRAPEVKLSSLTLPSTLYTDATTPDVVHTFTLDKWSRGGRYIIVRHAFKDQVEWLVVDTNTVAQSINVTRQLSVVLKDLQFNGTNGRDLIGLTADGSVRKLDVSSGTISRVLISNAESFSLLSETNIMSYIGIDPADATKRVAGVYRDGDEASHVLRTVNSLGTALRVAVSRYSNDKTSDYYVAIAEGSQVTILRGGYPASSNDDASSLKGFASMTLDAPVSRLSFSPSGDYVIAEAGSTFMSYEIEHVRSAKGGLDAAATPLQWLDVAHVWNQQNGQLVMRDFDNSNVYTIMPIAGNFDATLSQNGRYFYGIGKTDTDFTLQRVKMILE